jgi:ParB family transcriptional regulator, chromosome partitioning protein
MSKAAEILQRRFGKNLGESLGVRSAPTPLPAGQFPGETHLPGASPDDGRSRARDAGHMELDRIIPDPDQPRKDFAPDAIARLADSLKKHGQLQPIRVRWNATVGKWVVISGERRYRAAALAGLKTVACVFVDGELSPSELLQEQMVENCLREDLKPSEQAAAYRQLMNLHGWTAKELSEELHVSEASISKALKIERLEPELRDQVDSGEIPRTLAPGLAQLDEQDRLETAGRIVAGELTRDQAEEVIRRKVAGARGRGAKPRTSKKPPPPKPKVFRTRAGRVTVEPKSSGADSILAALLEAVESIRAGTLASEQEQEAA